MEVFDHERDYLSKWAPVVSIAEKIGCVPQTLREWVKKAEVESGKRHGVPTKVADKVRRWSARSVNCDKPSHLLMITAMPMASSRS